MGQLFTSLRSALAGWWQLLPLHPRLPPPSPADACREAQPLTGTCPAPLLSFLPGVPFYKAPVPEVAPPLLKELHINFFTAHIFGELAPQALPYDLNRMVLLYFAVAGLDLLGYAFAEDQRRGLVDAVYAMQVLPGGAGTPSAEGGFRPGPFAGVGEAGWPSPSMHEGDLPHITMTQAALLVLLILGDDLSRVDRPAVARLIAQCQTDMGCFMNVSFGSEQDVRFIFSACVVCELLSDWSGMDVERTVQFLQACQRYDGGFGESPHAEGHGGTTYCAVAALALLRRLDAVDLPRLVQWVTQRQGVGFHGRPNKLEDTCYTYWLGCTLALLGLLDLVDAAALERFVLGSQDAARGGIGKSPGQRPDLLHTFLPVAALGLLGLPGVAAVDPALGIAGRHVLRYSNARRPELQRQVAAQMPVELLTNFRTELT